VIRVPQECVDLAAHGPVSGVGVQVLVQVDWPELQLTDDQILANALATVACEPQPYPDPSLFMVELPFAVPRADGGA
jgi:hypothetical protein